MAMIYFMVIRFFLVKSRVYGGRVKINAGIMNVTELCMRKIHKGICKVVCKRRRFIRSRRYIIYKQHAYYYK